MKRYVRARRHLRSDIDRSAKLLTLTDCSSFDYNRDEFKFADDSGNSYRYEVAIDSTGIATTAFGKLLQESKIGTQFNISGRFIEPSESRRVGVIYNPRLLR